MKKINMFWNWLYWLCDCDRDELLLQIMRIMDLKGIKRRRLARWACEKECETSDALKILWNRYYKDSPTRQAELEKERSSIKMKHKKTPSK